MSKDYHKGVKLQVYIPEELNEKINACIEALNTEADNAPMYLQHVSKSDFVRLTLEGATNKYLNHLNQVKF